MIRKRRFLAWSAAMSALFTVMTALAPTPSGAQTQPILVVGADQTVTTKYRPLVGPNYQQGRRPASCAAASRMSCDTIPLHLDVPLESLQAEDYILSIKTIWNIKATVSAPLLADRPSDDQLNTFLYTDPPRVDEDGVIQQEADAFLQPSPTEVSLHKPPTDKFLITVENMYGINDGYTLEITLSYLGGGPGADRSADDGSAPFDFSDDSSVAVTPSFSGDSGAAGGILLPVPESFGGSLADFGDVGQLLTLDILSPRGDGDLDSLGGVEAQGSLELAEVKKIGRISAGPPPPQSASALALAFWFGVLPAALAAGAFFFIKRRRLPNPS